MRPIGVLGIILVALGLVALAIPSFTFFTNERAADVGFFTIDISRPHTIVFNPIIGGITVVVGIALTIVGMRTRSG